MKRALFCALFLVWRPMVGPFSLSFPPWVVELFLGHYIIYTPTSLFPSLYFMHTTELKYQVTEQSLNSLVVSLRVSFSILCNSLSLSLALQLGLWGE